MHGRGAFATRTIAAGIRIGEYAGERITFEESARRSEEELARGGRPVNYRFFLDDDWHIDGGSGGNDTRFINHGCDPNCIALTETRRIFISALRDIAEGEELLLDYRMGTDAPVPEEDLRMFACHCGAPTCRGTMLRSIGIFRRVAASP